MTTANTLKIGQTVLFPGGPVVLQKIEVFAHGLLRLVFENGSEFLVPGSCLVWTA